MSFKVCEIEMIRKSLLLSGESEKKNKRTFFLSRRHGVKARIRKEGIRVLHVEGCQVRANTAMS